MTQNTEKDTHFGFERVAWEDKQSRVRGVFDAVASRYDVMNDCMSFGLHRVWKKALIDQLAPHAGMRLLDVAGGTGDIALRALARAPEMDVTVCDINQAMLEEGRDRAIDRGMLSHLHWSCGNAEALPFPDASFDAYTIAFGIRNVTDIPAALKEAHRVLKPGGQFFCLEFSRVSPALAPFYERYSFDVIPLLGKLVTGDGAPYRYLVESIRQFPDQSRFAAMIRDAGFARVTYRNLTGGVAAIHSGRRT